MLLANPKAHIRLPSASDLYDPLFAVLAQDQAAVREKLYEYPSITIGTFCAYDFVLTKYPQVWAMGRGGIAALSHRKSHANFQSNR